ncbi:MAG: formyltransferase family protein [Gemmatimonadota bacterium]
MTGDHAPNRLSVVVLSCGPLGYEVANRISSLEEVGAVSLVQADYTRRQLSPVGKVRHVLKYQGWPGLWRVLASRLRKAETTREPASAPSLADGIAHYHFSDFHESACIAQLEAIGADLGVLAGTYILKESVFDVPRMGCINLHTGKAPEYRGAAPAFWELYNGETEVGVTVHEVTADLDAGRVLAQESFPLDSAPPGDPMDHVMSMRNDVLLPNGVRMLAEGVQSIARGTTEWSTQDSTVARTYRTPDYSAKKQLAKRVARRRRERGLVTTGRQSS